MNGRPPLLAARAAAKHFGSQLALAPTDFELAGGEAVALVRPNGAGKSTPIALLGDPDALLLDEPTAALDPEQRRRLWERLDAQRETGVALLFVTQHGDEVERHADRVVALREGAVAFVGPAAEYAAA